MVAASTPLVPVIFNVSVPFPALLVVVTVRVEEPEALLPLGMVTGGNEHVTPLGFPVTLNETVPVKPPEGVTVTLEVVEFPAVTDREDGLAEMVKFGGTTTKVAVPVCVSSEPLAVVKLPVMVNG